MAIYLRTILCALLTFAGGHTAFAKCFDLVGTHPSSLGPVVLSGPADKVCVNKVNGFGTDYWSVSFGDSQGDLAQFASQTEVLGRCPGFCRIYVLSSGNANGQNVAPDSTIVEFQVERSRGTLTISHGDSAKRTYRIAAE